MLLTLTFSTKLFDVNVIVKSQAEHSFAANLDILALNQLNYQLKYALFKII